MCITFPFLLGLYILSMVLINEEIPETFWKDTLKMFKCGFRNVKKQFCVAMVWGFFSKSSTLFYMTFDWAFFLVNIVNV